jgi:hypothetical protein
MPLHEGSPQAGFAIRFSEGCIERLGERPSDERSAKDGAGNDR